MPVMYRTDWLRRGCAEGRIPSPGVWGCPPDAYVSSPFLARKGARGMVEVALSNRYIRI